MLSRFTQLKAEIRIDFTRILLAFASIEISKISIAIAIDIVINMNTLTSEAVAYHVQQIGHILSIAETH